MAPQPIAIVGGGIGGLTAAIALNKRGIPAMVYEQARTLEEMGAGLALWANATRLLEALGVMGPLLAAGTPLTEMHTTLPNGRLLKKVRLHKLAARFGSPSIVLRRSDLQRTLLDAVPRGQVQLGKHCIRVDFKPEGVQLYFADGTHTMAQAVVFADGVHSLARGRIFGFPDVVFGGRVAWRGLAQVREGLLDPKVSHEITGSGRRIGMFPLPGNQVYWFATVTMTEAAAKSQKRTVESVLSHFKGWPRWAEEVIQSTPENRIIVNPLYHAPEVPEMVMGNIALLGDAAHPMMPDLGQGACQAIEDACALADALAKHKGLDAGFKAYETLRLDRVRYIVRESHRMGLLRQADDPKVWRMRNFAMRFIPEGYILRMIGRALE